MLTGTASDVDWKHDIIRLSHIALSVCIIKWKVCKEAECSVMIGHSKIFSHQFLIILLVSYTMMITSFVRLKPQICSQVTNRIITARFLTTNIFIVGKNNGGEQFIADGYAEYEKRLTPVMKINTIFLKSDEALVEATKKVKGTVIAMDENGSQYSSRAFSDLVYKGLEDGGANLTFAIGGFAGLPPEIKKSYPLISLSKMTWTHQMARLLLIEQIYRAVEIRKGSGYHKD